MKLLKNIASNWRGGRNYYFDECGECVSASGWTFNLDLVFGNIPTAYRLSVYSSFNSLLRINRNNRPRSWCSYLTTRGTPEMEVSRGRCQSLRDAREQAEEALTDDLIKESLRRFYGPSGSYQLWDKNGRPFCTLLAHSMASSLPSGIYIAREYGGDSFLRVDRSTWCTSWRASNDRLPH